MKEKSLDERLLHFADRNCTSNDYGKAIFTLKALHLEIDNLKDNKSIGVMHGHLESKNLISIEQHGFVSSNAFVTNLLECLDLTTNALNKYGKLDDLYIDFMKESDKVYRR